MNPISRADAGSECVVCGGVVGGTLLFELHRPIRQCINCGLVYAEPSNNKAYNEYTESYYVQGVYADYMKDRPVIRKNAVRMLTRLERLVEGRRLLDVGCSAGFFLEAARARGWTVQGLDVSEFASKYAREKLKLHVETGSIVSPPNSLPAFDVITLWDTIEHLDRPDIALENIRRRLHPQGLFVFSTGDYGSLLRRLMGKRWRLFSDPTHNYFFDVSSLRRLLRRTGFDVTGMSRQGKWVSLSMILHQTPLPLAVRASRWVGARGLNPALYVNLRDVVTFFASPGAKDETEFSKNRITIVTQPN